MPRPRKRKAPSGVPHLLRQRGKKRFWTAWLAGTEVSLGTADAVEASKRLHELAAERARTASIDQAEKAVRLTVLAAKYIDSVQPPHRSPRTAQSIESRVLQFVEFAEEQEVVDADALNRKLLQQFIDARAKSGASARTINRDLTPVMNMIRFGERVELLSAAPLSAETYLSLRLREPTPAPNLRTLSEAQVDTFIKRAYEILHVAYASLFDLMAGSGARLDEACHIDAVDLDVARRIVRITPKPGGSTKNHRFREIPASEATIKAARLFIRSRAEVSLDRKKIWNQLQRVRKEVGLPKFSPHDLRRAWASAMHQRGASLKAVSVWLGHGSLGVTERYVRVVETDGHRFLPR
jgi:site-specific recombinase XerD